MAGLLNQFEQFLALFENLKTVAGEPNRLATFYSESSAIRDAAERLENFAMDLGYSILFGPKRWGPVPAGFRQAWAEYEFSWGPAIAYGSTCYLLRESLPEFRRVVPYNPDIARGMYRGQYRGLHQPCDDAPDPERDDFFDPRRHDGGSALKLGVEYWRSEYNDWSEKARAGENVDDANFMANLFKIALDAFDFLTLTIGIDINDIFRRWREIPPIFVPPAVSNKHGDEKGSLNDLLDNAVRAYVCGAPAAAIAMCRATLEMVLKLHFLPDDHLKHEKNGNLKRNARGELLEEGLSGLIVMAEKRYNTIKSLNLKELRDAGDQFLHRYHSKVPLSRADEKAIIQYMVTLKTLIQIAG